MQFYSIFRYIARRFPPGKWVSLGQTVESGSKNSNFFTGVRWHLLQVLLINADIISDIALSEDLVLLREGWYKFISTRHSLQVTYAVSSCEGAEKVYHFQVPYSIPHPSTKTINNKSRNEYIICYLSVIYRPPWPPSLFLSLPHNTYLFIVIILITISPQLYISPPLSPVSFYDTLTTTPATHFTYLIPPLTSHRLDRKSVV